MQTPVPPMPMPMMMPTPTPPGMRSADQRLLVALVATADRGVPFRSPTGIEAARIVALARHHRLSPLLSIGSRPAGFSPEIAETFRRDRLSTLGRSTLLRHALSEILAALDARGVEVAVLKGIAYEDLIYPDPGTRPSSDIDLLVRGSERRAALGTLARLGYRPSAGAPGFDQPDYHEVSFRRDAVNVDLHFALAPLVRGAIDYRALWNDMRTWSFAGRVTKTPSFVHAAVNQALHMAIHHFDVPALYLLDFRRLAAMATTAAEQRQEAGAAGTDTDARLRAAARAWGCLRPLETTLALASAFLDDEATDAQGREPGLSWLVQRVIAGYGGLEPVSRPEQLARKILSFDHPRTAARYLWVQGRRILREHWLTRFGRARSATERLGLDHPDPPIDNDVHARPPPRSRSTSR
jgi:hypothetical protein